MTRRPAQDQDANDGGARKKRAAPLRLFCADHGLPTFVLDALERQAGYIHTFKTELLPATMSPTMRARALASVQSQAEELRRQIEALPSELRWALDDQYLRTSRQRGVPASAGDLYQEGGVHISEHDLGGSVLPRIEAAAAAVGGRLQAAGGAGKAGRLPVTERQADFIRCIAQAVKPAGMKPSREGVFRELCEVVFEAGGMTLPVRALNHFLRAMRPALQRDGYCL